MAEFVMKRYVRRAGLEEEFEIASAGTSDEEQGNPVFPLAKRKLAEHGVGCPGKTANQVTAADMERYDLIVCMDSKNLDALSKTFGSQYKSKTSLLLDHLPSNHKRAGQDVADPWYTRNFDAAWSDIDAGCKALFEQLTQE